MPCSFLTATWTTSAASHPLADRLRAPIFVHELDRRILTNFEERVVVASKALEAFLVQAGVKPELRTTLREMYLFAKTFIRSVPQVEVMEEGDFLFDTIRVIHTPGHCPGQVCLLVDDVLLAGDHVLARTTPHLAPEKITAYTGLGHYLESLDKIAALQDVRLVLGGHEAPIEDVSARVEAIRRSHRRKLERFLELCREPRTVAELSMAHYGRREGYDILLAIEEAGAHVEYLYQRGYLAIANLDEVEHSPHPVLRYRRL
ncbi:MAG: MBL fold metallo-hydrolase [Ardenticatenia bacterium]|nr:MBL fold metallo-hydrolase [Ardenticatenia bacterium]